MVLHQYTGVGSIQLWYAVVAAYSVPLVIGGVRTWLDKLNGVLLPFYYIGLTVVVIWTIVRHGYSNDWLTAGPVNPHVSLHAPGWFFAFTTYMGVWIMMPFVDCAPGPDRRRAVPPLADLRPAVLRADPAGQRHGRIFLAHSLRGWWPSASSQRFRLWSGFGDRRGSAGVDQPDQDQHRELLSCEHQCRELLRPVAQDLPVSHAGCGWS